jgi:uncharacterized membrane protein
MTIQSAPTAINRIESIDILRGIVMVIMALDHVRDMVHVSSFTGDPLNPETTTPILYFTRWITHFCAPSFVFLSGTSIYLQSLRKTKKELSAFIFKRGLWLIFIEVAVMALVMSFNPFYNFIFLQVIWTIGISMVLLSVLIYLPFRVILALGLVIVLGHNLLDIPESAPGFKAGFLWDLLHSGLFDIYPLTPDHNIVILYPFLAWTGLMMLGYCTGHLFSPGFAPADRKKILSWAGLGLILFFILLRWTNIYGNPSPWTSQADFIRTLYSFFNVQKYPPSLLFLSITIGPALIVLALLEDLRNGFTRFMKVFGRVALFYYILHFFLAHVLAAIFFLLRGHPLAAADDHIQTLPFYFLVPGEGISLGGVYLCWIGLILFLYPLCRWYDRYKTNHKEKWWLSYL